MSDGVDSVPDNAPDDAPDGAPIAPVRHSSGFYRNLLFSAGFRPFL